MQAVRQILLIAVFITTVFSSNAQMTKASKQQPVTDSVARLMCGCIGQYKDSIGTRQQLFNVLQSCLQQYSVPSMDALLAEDGFVQTDDRKTRAAAIRAIGQKLGARVLAGCDGVKALINTFNDEAPKKEMHQP